VLGSDINFELMNRNSYERLPGSNVTGLGPSATTG
jgi:hypothetical protein